MKLEEIKVGDRIEGLVPEEIATIIQTVFSGDDALTLYYSTPSKPVDQQVIYREAAEQLKRAERKDGYKFDAKGDEFKLGLEAMRLSLGSCVDPMIAVESSKVEPYPHQIQAVYGEMLPRRPLRFVLADDPGAGKTIMAGLLIKEMILRDDARRVLVVAPGALVEQWQDELNEKFDLQFNIFSPEMRENSRTGNPFNEHPLLVAKLDQIARNYQGLIESAQEWDLVIIDEAHKCSPTSTTRYPLAELLGDRCRHFLLMTATPHNGKEEEFRRWMALLDSDRFSGKARDNLPIQLGDVMRRMVKEDLRKFDGSSLFPPRYAYTVNYNLSDQEMALYENVTAYVRDEMNRADTLEGPRRGRVGFAMTILQRRLASSPEAIYQSLKRRHKRLTVQLEKGLAGEDQLESEENSDEFNNLDEDDFLDLEDQLRPEEYERFSDKVLNGVTASRTADELRREISVLEGLEKEAEKLVASGEDSKWRELRGLFVKIEKDDELCDESGRMRKLIIFTEHRDTLDYLKRKITNLLGLENSGAVQIIHGGTDRDTRRRIQEEFCNNPEVRVLIATDAAGEGVNLQRANMMINYDLPWNPNRIEQRFGRIHRIGQELACHLWNLVAHQTREGRVFATLFGKLEVQRQALGGRVFDVLGAVFTEVPLRQLLIKAIRGGDAEIIMADRQIDQKMSTENLRVLIERRALSPQLMNPETVDEIREKMEEAQARKLQPCYLRGFFVEAFKKLGGDIRKTTEMGRYEIRTIPRSVYESNRFIAASRETISSQYGRVCFEKEQIQPNSRVSPAAFLHLGHPLLDALIDAARKRFKQHLGAGTVLVNRSDPGNIPSVVLMLEHRIRESDGKGLASHRLFFVRIDAEGHITEAGFAPHLDTQEPNEEEKALIKQFRLTEDPWLETDLQKRGIDFANVRLKETVSEVIRQRREYLNKAWDQTYECLTAQIDRATESANRIEDDVNAGRKPLIQLQKLRADARDLRDRLERYKDKINQQKQLQPESPSVLGAYLEVPRGWFDLKAGRATLESQRADAQARKKVERIAMEAVSRAERDQGHDVKDVSGDNIGWDITSRRKEEDGGYVERCIEVKGHAKESPSRAIYLTCNEVNKACNLKERHILAIVLVNPDDSTEGPYYIQNFFLHELEPGIAGQSYFVKALLDRAVRPEDTI